MMEFGHYLRWTVHRPIRSSVARTSPIYYTPEGERFYFRFCLRNGLYVLSIEANLMGSCRYWITVHVEKRESHALSISSRRVNVEGNDNTIWIYGETELLNANPNFRIDGLVTFLFIFDPKYEVSVMPHPNMRVRTSHLFPVSPPSMNVIQKETKFVQTSSNMHTIPCLETLSTDLTKMLDENSQQDVALVCGDHTVEAHRNVLCSRSKVLDAMLQNQTWRIDVDDMEPAILDQFLRYLYTGMLDDLSADTAKLLYEVGHKYEVPSLVKRCSRFLEASLQPEIACEMLVLANDRNDRDFMHGVMDYIVREEIHLEPQVPWLAFCEQNPKLASEVLISFSIQQRKKRKKMC